jgi:hypothetical protein
MTLRIPGSGTLKGVAVGVLAATLPATGCRADRDDGRDAAVAEEGTIAVPLRSAALLETRWLIAPDPSLEPPLAAPVALEVDRARNRLLILELQPPELRVYDLRDGRFRATLGREGDGPGEYRYPSAIAVDRTGVAAVLSMGGRLTFWKSDGTLAGIVRIGAGMSTDIVAAQGDSFYVKTDRFPPEDVAEFRVATPDTVLARPRFRDAGIPGTEEPGRSLKNHSYAVGGTPDGGLLISPPGPDYVILRLGVKGRVRQKIRRPEVGPLRRSEKEIEAIRERVRKSFAAAGRSAPADLSVPLYRPHVSRLAVASDGSIWALTRRGDGSTAIIDSFAADGSFVASYRVPLRVADLAVTSDAIYFLARADLDVPGVAVAARPRETSAESPGGDRL